MPGMILAIAGFGLIVASGIVLTISWMIIRLTFGYSDDLEV